MQELSKKSSSSAQSSSVSHNSLKNLQHRRLGHLISISRLCSKDISKVERSIQTDISGFGS